MSTGIRLLRDPPLAIYNGLYHDIRQTLTNTRKPTDVFLLKLTRVPFTDWYTLTRTSAG